MKPLARALLISLVFSAVARGAGFDPAEERIMEVSFSDGTPVSEAFTVFLHEHRWYLPVVALSYELGIQLERRGREAHGFVFSEGRDFSLSVNEDGGCRFRYRKEEKKCGDLIVQGDDWWVPAAQIEEWFPLRLKIDSFASTIQVMPQEPFPAQLREERERVAKQAAFRQGGREQTPERRVPYTWLDGAALDQLLTGTYAKSSGASGTSLSHQTALAGEVAGFETRAYATGEGGHFDEPRLTFRRYSAEGNLLGGLHASEVQLFDVEFPSQNLLGGAGLGRGLLLERTPPSGGGDFRSQDISGDLLPGWEVELYQNETLLGRQTASGQGRFLFAAVPLRYGLNSFRLVFYGPQGQKREELRNFNVDPSIAKPGAANYRVALVQNHERGRARAPRVQVNGEKNLFGSVGVKAGFTRFTPNHETAEVNYYNLGLRGFYHELFLYADSSALGTGRGALELGAQDQVLGASVGITHTMLNDFVSDEFERVAQLKYQSKLSAATSILRDHGVRATVDVVRKSFLDQTVAYALQNRLSARTGPLYWFNDLAYEWGTAHSFTGKLTPLLLINTTQVRSELEYDQRRLLSANVLLQTALTRDFKLDLGVSSDLRARKLLYNLGLNRDFGVFTGSLTASQSNRRETSVAALFSYSLGYYPGNLHVDSRPQTEEGAAAVRVFRDRNRNGIFDSGDDPLPGIILNLNGQEQEGKTDGTGRAYLHHLPVHEPSEIGLALRSITDPALRPQQPALQIRARAGKTAEVELPLIVTGEISGYVRGRTGGRGLGYKIILLKRAGSVVKEIKSQSDGYFIAEGVEPGTYTLELANGGDREPRAREITIPEQGGFFDKQNFTVSENP